MTGTDGSFEGSIWEMDEMLDCILKGVSIVMDVCPSFKGLFLLQRKKYLPI